MLSCIGSLHTVASFALTRPAFRGNERIQRFRLKSSLVQPNKDISTDSLISSKEKKGTELWLDLRGTALYPSAAIAYLMEQLTDDEYDPSLAEGAPNPIDRVVLSDQMFQRLLDTPDHPLEGTEIMYLPDDGDGLVASSHEGMSFPCGKIFKMPKDSDMVLADPMSAIETISQGNWAVLVDEKSGIDSHSEVNRVDSIASFLNLAVAAAGGPSLMVDGSSGLLLKSSDYEDTTEIGGVAVSCSNKAMVIQLASVVQDIQSGSSMASTESGILIQGTSDSDSSSPSLQTALLLPFDVVMWKTALLIYGEIPQNEEEEE
jgi:hypothetical protein